MRMPWKLHGDGSSVPASAIVLPEERLSWPRTIGFGAQHVVAMFGATFLVPVITGFPPSTTLLFSGIGTILFLLVTGNRLPSYLGSSFAFIAPITAATAAGGPGAALAGVIIVGVLLALVGIVAHLAGTRWIDALMPPVVAGAIVALIGFNLAPVARDNFLGDPLIALITLVAVILSAVVFRGLPGRLSIFIGVIAGYVAAALRPGGIDLSGVAEAPWIGLPELRGPEFSAGMLPVYLMFLPVVLVLVAENVGHVKGVGQLTGRNMDALTGRALFADGLATVLAGFGGGSPTTTYGENIGVMAATRVYSTAAYWVAAIAAILLGLSPKVGALISSIPAGVLGGVTTALYGLIGIIGVRIWVEHRVDFGRPKHQLTAAVALIMGIADFTVSAGSLSFNGIVLGSAAAILVYHLMDAGGRLFRTDVSAAAEVAEGAGGANQLTMARHPGGGQARTSRGLARAAEWMRLSRSRVRGGSALHASTVEEPELSDLLLRPWRASDAGQLLAIVARSPDLERQLPYAIDSEALAAQWIEEMNSEPGRHVFAIEHEGLAVGAVAVSAPAGSDVAWVWYWVDSAARGRGLATRALVRLCEWALARRGGGFRRLELGYRVNNPASAAVAARAGFLVEGREREKFVIDGYAIDVRTAARLRSDPAPELNVSDVGFELP